MTAIELGKTVRERRKALGLTQAEVAFASGLGGRFISDLENGKETCQLGKTLLVLQSLGLQVEIHGR